MKLLPFFTETKTHPSSEGYTYHSPIFTTSGRPSDRSRDPGVGTSFRPWSWSESRVTGPGRVPTRGPWEPYGGCPPQEGRKGNGTVLSTLDPPRTSPRVSRPTGRPSPRPRLPQCPNVRLVSMEARSVYPTPPRPPPPRVPSVYLRGRKVPSYRSLKSYLRYSETRERVTVRD